MAIKKPLVVGSSGLPEQLQNTDSLGTAELLAQLNGNAGALVIGCPVYSSANDTVDKAMANAVGTVKVIGLMADVSTANGVSGAVITDGVLTATTVQWDAITGGSGGLVRDTLYFLDAATAGKLTATPPTTTGQFVKLIGVAISTTELKITIGYHIKL